VDSGYSFTTIVPFFNGLPLKHATVRIDVGGKLLTNLLMETLSYKEVNMRGEGFIVNQIKESLSFVSTQFMDDLEVATKSSSSF
jgi:actin-related protein 6